MTGEACISGKMSVLPTPDNAIELRVAFIVPAKPSYKLRRCPAKGQIGWFSAENTSDMRLFRKKADSPAHQEYLNGLISSIRQARRIEEEKPDLHAFVEEDGFPITDTSRPGRVSPGALHTEAPAEPDEPAADANEIANLEAYLSRLDAAPPPETDEPEDDSPGESV